MQPAERQIELYMFALWLTASVTRKVLIDDCVALIISISLTFGSEGLLQPGTQFFHQAETHAAVGLLCKYYIFFVFCGLEHLSASVL